MPINREEYDNPEVNNATNPSSYGHHHGPVQNPNADWDPECMYTWLYLAYANSWS